MPLPLPPRSSKRETKKSRSSKVVPSDHGQSEKRGEKYRAKISPSSPQGPLKKRSALEDVTNASQSQPAQLKKEANKESAKDVSKKINRNTPTLRLAENDEMNTKKHYLMLLPTMHLSLQTNHWPTRQHPHLDLFIYRGPLDRPLDKP